MKTKNIQYISPEQVLDEVIGDLRQSGKYDPGFLYRCFLSKNIGSLEEKGNDREGSYDCNETEACMREYRILKQRGELPDDMDVENFEIMDIYGLQAGDFIFASTEEEIKVSLSMGGIGDHALMRLYNGLEEHALAVYDGKCFNELINHGFEFLDKSREGKLDSLVEVYEFSYGSEEADENDKNYQRMIERMRRKHISY